MRERCLGQRELQIAKLTVELVDSVAHPEPEIDSDLIVARAGGVQSARGGADDFGEARFDVHVNVFQRARKIEAAAFDLASNLVETGGNGLGVLFRDDSHGGEHGHMRLRSCYILSKQGLIEPDRRVDFLHDRVGRGFEPSAPHLVAHEPTPEPRSMTEQTTRPAPRKTRTFLISGGLLLVAAGVVYGIIAPAGKKGPSLCPASDAVLGRVAQLEKGAVAAATSPKQAQPMIALDFLGPDGKPTSLAAFKGRVTLVNLWATWCVPCREEMPTLDRLQGELGSKDFEVVTINVDTARLERAREFLKDISVKNLAFYSDPKADVFYRLRTAGKVVGLPTTFLVGRDGCEIAGMAGPADWASADAIAMIRAAF